MYTCIAQFLIITAQAKRLRRSRQYVVCGKGSNVLSLSFFLHKRPWRWKRREETDGQISLMRFGDKLDIGCWGGEIDEGKMSNVHLK